MKTEGRPQISPLRYASVEMTILFEHKISRFPGDIRGNRGSPASLGMTNERVTSSWKVVAEKKTFFGSHLDRSDHS
jgi:hypothetical protein